MPIPRGKGKEAEKHAMTQFEQVVNLEFSRYIKIQTSHLTFSKNKLKKAV